MKNSTLRKSSGSFLFPTLLALTSIVSPAHAEDVDEKARILYQKGNTAFKKGDEVMAREHYRESLELKESFDTACNLGRAEAQSKLYEEAYAHLRLCIYLYPKDEELADAREKFVALRDNVRNEISTETQHEIDARFDETMRDREEAARGPQSGLDETPGAAKDEPRPGSADVTGSFGEMQAPSWKMPVVWSLAAGGVASGILGGVMLAASSSASSDAEDLRSGDVTSCRGSDEARCSELANAVESYDSRKNVSTVAFAAGGVLVVGAVIAYFAIPDEPVETAGVIWSPLAGVTPDGNMAFGVRGSF